MIIFLKDSNCSHLFIISSNFVSPLIEWSISFNNTDSRALQFDHIEGNGNKFRKTRRSYHSMMVYFKKNPNLAKSLLQVLCANCNQLKKFDNNEVANR